MELNYIFAIIPTIIFQKKKSFIELDEEGWLITTREIILFHRLSFVDKSKNCPSTDDTEYWSSQDDNQSFVLSSL